MLRAGPNAKPPNAKPWVGGGRRPQQPGSHNSTTAASCFRGARASHTEIQCGRRPSGAPGRFAKRKLAPFSLRFQRSVEGRSPRRRVPQTKSSSACPESRTVPQPTAVPSAATQRARRRPTTEHGPVEYGAAGRRPEKSHTGDVARSIPGAGFTSLGYSCNLDGLRFVDAPFHVHYIGTLH